MTESLSREARSARRKRIAQAVAAGVAMSEVCRSYRISPATVRLACIEHDVGPPVSHGKHVRRPHRHSVRVAFQILAMLRSDAGWRSEEIGRRCGGVARQYVEFIRKQATDAGLLERDTE